MDDPLNPVTTLPEATYPSTNSDLSVVTVTSEAQLRHQLRTPLNQILGYAELLIEENEAEGASQIVPDLKRIQQAGQHLLELINQHFAGGDQQSTPEGSTPSTNPSLTPTASHPTANGHEPSAVRQGDLNHERATGVASARILVVDDELANRDLLVRRLEHEGHRTALATGGAQALELMAEHKFDLVLLDALMPDVDGIDVLQQMRNDSRLQRIPVIMLSALDDLSHVVRCIELGAEDYLPKPFNPIILRARINASLEKKRLRDTEAQLFEQLRQGYDRLTAMERWREDWTQMLVHDLRTPLTAILGSLQTLTYASQNAEVPPEIHTELIEISTQSANSLLSLVNDLLDVAQLESGTFKLDLARVNVRDVVAEVVAQMNPLALYKEIALTSSFPAQHNLTVNADARKLARVLVNLVANAIKFTPVRGLVAVEVTPQNGAVRFVVRDTGEGIPSDALSFIFQKFGQIESQDANYKGGNGLGLTFCKLVLEAHGGTISVESEVGKGSTFTFDLPKV